jgi:putative transcriptional regulator
MTTHPNRGRAPRAGANPKPAEIRAARLAAGLTEEQAGALVYATGERWRAWEEGARRMHPAHWELFSIKKPSQDNG